MKILLDLQGCQSSGSRTRGIGRYSSAFARALIRNGGEHEFWLLLNGAFEESIEPLREEFRDLVPPERIRVFQPPRDHAKSADAAQWRAGAAELIRRHLVRAIAPDIVHVSSLFEGLADECVTEVDPAPHGIATSVTLYDLIPLLNAERYLADERTRTWYMRKLESLRRADLLLGISASACEEARAALDGSARIVNVSTASDPAQFHPGAARPVAARLGLTRPFVMYTGGIDWRKNIDGLVAAYAALPRALRNAYQLALVCKTEDYARIHIMEQAREHGLAPGDVVLTGFVSDEDLVDLYRSCALFVFPSIHEGFGLPALEAMMCGARVIGSNTSSVPEIIQMPGAQFDPRSVPEMAAMLERGLSDPAFREELRVNGAERARAFSWDATAREALRAMEETVAERRRAAAPAVSATPASPARPALAIVAPLPPAQSGIAEYGVELLAVLREHYDITLVAEQEETRLPGDLATLPVRDSAWLRANAVRFDRVLYQFGNSSVHGHMFPLLRAVPGLVVLHDFFLSGVLNWLEVLGNRPGAFSLELFGSHGAEAMAYEREHGRDAAVLAFPCNRGVLDRASGVIVHSRFARETADKWYGEGYSRDWRQIPLLRALPPAPDRAAARAALGIAPGEFVVCSFGHLGHTKLNDRLLRAWTRSTLAGDGVCSLVFVGEIDQTSYGEGIQRMLNALPSRRARITGYADRAVYEQYLAACDVAVQLRSSSRGETSGAVLDCLAFGVPLVANAHGPAVEYPPDIMFQLADEFGDDDLVGALERLRADAGLRESLGHAGRAWVANNHDPRAIGLQYASAIEEFSARPQKGAYWNLVNEIADLGEPDADLLVETAVAIRESMNP